jgi:predicted DNA-binding transcriptional regulator YafY
MNRFDRMLGLLLLLRGGKPIAAKDLARKFEVSRRTIYRDIDTLSELGVPVFAERGREGGFQLLEGFFLPPLMFTPGEAVSLILGLALWRSLHARPFLADLESAERKLLAIMPAELRNVLTQAQRIVGFEEQPADIFHREPEPNTSTNVADMPTASISTMGGVFLNAILNHQSVRFKYRSPYREQADDISATPQGMFWDRGRWYLVGAVANRKEGRRIWRADRLQEIRATGQPVDAVEPFDVRAVLGRKWLHAAMQEWSQDSPVRIRLTAEQAGRLQQDWYYRFARFEPDGSGSIITYGESQQELAFELMRWLGPGAELLEPGEWRAALGAELRRMAEPYS